MTVTQLLHSGRERGQGCKDDSRSVPGAWVQSLGGELEGPEVPCGQEEKRRVREMERPLVRRKPQREEERG